MIELQINGHDAHYARNGNVVFKNQKLWLFVRTSNWEKQEKRAAWISVWEYTDISGEFAHFLQIALWMGKRVTSLLETKISLETQQAAVQELELRWIDRAILLNRVNVRMHLDRIIPKVKQNRLSVEIRRAGSVSVSEKIVSEQLRIFNAENIVRSVTKELVRKIELENGKAKQELGDYADHIEKTFWKKGQPDFYRTYMQDEIDEVIARLRKVREEPGSIVWYPEE